MYIKAKVACCLPENKAYGKCTAQSVLLSVPHSEKARLQRENLSYEWRYGSECYI
jgi:hypothetical protein